MSTTLLCSIGGGPKAPVVPEWVEPEVPSTYDAPVPMVAAVIR